MADIKKNEKYRKKEKPDTEILTIGRMPPQNVEAEMAVLGAMLLDKDAIIEAEDVLTMKTFIANKTLSSSRRFCAYPMQERVRIF